MNRLFAPLHEYCLRFPICRNHYLEHNSAQTMPRCLEQIRHLFKQLACLWSRLDVSWWFWKIARGLSISHWVLLSVGLFASKISFYIYYIVGLSRSVLCVYCSLLICKQRKTVESWVLNYAIYINVNVGSVYHGSASVPSSCDSFLSLAISYACASDPLLNRNPQQMMNCHFHCRCYRFSLMMTMMTMTRKNLSQNLCQFFRVSGQHRAQGLQEPGFSSQQVLAGVLPYLPEGVQLLFRS